MDTDVHGYEALIARPATSDLPAYDVVICTYNRVQPLLRVLEGLFKQTRQPDHIYIVDSSTDQNSVRTAVRQLSPPDPSPGIVLVRASHANVAYQRWLGFKVSASDVVAYFDDDVVFGEPDMMERVLGLFAQPDVVGASVELDYHNPLVHDPALRSFTTTMRRTTVLRQVQKGVDWLTGLPSPKPGEVGLCGVRGPVPAGEVVQVKWLPGPCMVFRRQALSDTCFSNDLLAVFEKKLATGEDLVISSFVGRTGRLLLLRDCHLKHPGDFDTVAYPSNTRRYARTMSYSRLFLSLSATYRLGYSKLVCRLHYYYYAAWRLLGAGLRVFTPPLGKHLALCVGWAEGILLNLCKPPTHAAWTPEIDWAADVERDGARIESLITEEILIRNNGTVR